MSNNSVGSSLKIKKGAVFSFLAIIFEIVVNFFLLRYLTKGLGSDYGLYTLALNTISIFLVDFGLGQSVTKFISKYRLNNDKIGENNFLGIVLKIYFFLDCFVLLACLAVFFFIPFIYKGLSASEIENFKTIFIIVSFYSVISFPMLPLNGILQGHEEFSIIKILSMVQKGLCTLLLAGCLIFKTGLLSAVFVNIVTALLISLIKLIIVFKKNQIRPNIKYHNKELLKTILGFTVWIAISAVASRISLSIMPTILATVQDSSSVAVFGIAITLETYAYLFSTAISGLFLPKVTKDVESEDFNALNKSAISIGKFQTVISSLLLVGFVLFGKEFLGLYLEPMYLDAYLPTVILFACVLFSSSLIIPQTISFAMGTIKFVAIIELIISAIRLGLCWLFAKYFGLLGLTICYFVLEFFLNICKLVFVYYKKQKLTLKKFCIDVYLKSLIPICISIIVGILLKRAFYSSGWPSFLISCLILAIIFLVSSFLFYLTKDEKQLILTKLPFFKKISRVFKNGERSNNYVPTFMCYLLIVLSMFTSNYPITKIALAALLIFFSISAFIFYYFCLLKKVDENKRLKKEFIIRNFSLWFVVVFTFLIAITVIETRSFESILGMSKYLLIIWSAFLFAQIFSFKIFLKAFRDIFLIVCLLSLFFSFIIFAKNSNFSPLITDFYYNYYFVFFSIIRTGLIGHNCAIFWEPGIFASFCCIALVCQILFDKRKWYKQIVYYVVFVISLLSTGSLAGYILLVVVFPLFLTKFNKKTFNILSWIIIVTFIFVIVSFAPFYQYYIKIFPVLQSKGLSLTTRFYCMFVDFEIFKTSPIFGVGSKYSFMFDNIAESLYPGLLDTSLNTFGFYLASFGIAGILFFLVFTCSIFLTKRLSALEKTSCFLLGFLIFSKEPHTLSLVSMIFLFYFMKDFNPFLTFENPNNNEVMLNNDD